MNVFTILYDLIKILGYPGLSSVCQAYQQEMMRSQTRLPSTSIKAGCPGEHQKVGTWMFIHPFMWNIPGLEITVLTIPETGCLSCHSIQMGTAWRGRWFRSRYPTIHRLMVQNAWCFDEAIPVNLVPKLLSMTWKPVLDHIYLLHPRWTYQSLSFILILDTPN